MIRFLADEDFNNDIVRGVRLRNPAVDFLRVQDVGLRTAGDSDVLEWVAREGRVLLTHDESTVPPLAWARLGAGLPLPGVFVIRQPVQIALAIEAILFVAEASEPGEWEGGVHYLPL